MFNYSSRPTAQKATRQILSNELLPFLMAATWHLMDAFITMTPQKKKTKALWVGVGVGWSMFWLVRHFVKSKPLVETRSYYDQRRNN
jgi:hypothetical protein